MPLTAMSTGLVPSATGRVCAGSTLKPASQRLRLSRPLQLPQAARSRRCWRVAAQESGASPAPEADPNTFALVSVGRGQWRAGAAAGAGGLARRAGAWCGRRSSSNSPPTPALGCNCSLDYPASVRAEPGLCPMPDPACEMHPRTPPLALQAPSKPQSAVGQMVAYYLQMQPHLFR